MNLSRASWIPRLNVSVTSNLRLDNPGAILHGNLDRSVTGPIVRDDDLSTHMAALNAASAVSVAPASSFATRTAIDLSVRVNEP